MRYPAFDFTGPAAFDRPEIDPSTRTVHSRRSKWRRSNDAHRRHGAGVLPKTNYSGRPSMLERFCTTVNLPTMNGGASKLGLMLREH